MTAPTIKVWDPLVRALHWGVVASFAVAWLTADAWDSVHEAAGYAIAGIVAIRLLWGLVGPRYARFSQFVRSPMAALNYLRQIVLGREPRHLGHNPAGGLMIVGLLAALAVTALTGWLHTTDVFQGVRWLRETHEFFANLLLVMVGIHVAGVLVASLRHKENLVRAMVVGRKRVPQANDVI